MVAVGEGVKVSVGDGVKVTLGVSVGAAVVGGGVLVAKAGGGEAVLVAKAASCPITLLHDAISKSEAPKSAMNNVHVFRMNHSPRKNLRDKRVESIRRVTVIYKGRISRS